MFAELFEPTLEKKLSNTIVCQSFRVSYWTGRDPTMMGWALLAMSQLHVTGMDIAHERRCRPSRFGPCC